MLNFRIDPRISYLQFSRITIAFEFLLESVALTSRASLARRFRRMPFILNSSAVMIVPETMPICISQRRISTSPGTGWLWSFSVQPQQLQIIAVLFYKSTALL